MISPVILEDVIKVAKARNKAVDVKMLNRAYSFSQKAHGSQKRSSGEDYMQHPLHTAHILAKIGMSSDVIAAGLLHDVPEDTKHTLEEIEKEFGKEIAFLIEGVTKIGKVRLGKERAKSSWERDKKKDKKPKDKKAREKERGQIDREYLYMENLRRMVLAMAADIRTVIIKLADRLHNMQTLDSLSPEKQYRIAKETLEVYAPLANRLGMGEIKGTLEDLSFAHVYPRKYREIEKMTRGEYRYKEKLAAKAIDEIREVLTKEKQKIIDVHGRAKHLYSLYVKLLRYDMNLDKIHDLVAVRVLVPGIPDCYEALGIIHKHYRPLLGRIKDYISLPKPNGYRSLHTTVFGPQKSIIEVQIRTPEMHYEAEFGIAAHWFYDEQTRGKSLYNYLFSSKPSGSKIKEFQNLKWVQQLSKWNTEMGRDPKEFFRSLKVDFFRDRIFAFTPKGDVINLPEGATPVDFAYLVHTEIGDSCIGAKIDGRKVSLDYKIRNGEVVEIITNKSKRNPDRQWLDFVKTSLAKSEISRWLRKNSRRGLDK